MRQVGRLALLLFVCLMMLVPPVFAETVDVTIGVGDTILKVSGITSPGAFVTIVEDGNVIGTVAADADGLYQQTFPAQSPGIHELKLHAHTVTGLDTDTVTLNINIGEHATTTADVFLPTALIVGDNSLEYNQPLTLSGETAPLSTVTIYIDNNTFATAPTDAQGLWDISLLTTGLAAGQHGLFARVTDSHGNQSYPTVVHFFTLEGPPGQPGGGTPGTGGTGGTGGGGTPTTPVIDAPGEGSTQNPVVIVGGTGQPNTQVEIWNGDTIVGSVWVDAKGRWSFVLHLGAGPYELKARACLNKVCSEFSPVVPFTYTPLKPLALPLRFILPQTIFTITEDHWLAISARVLDGTGPYTTRTSWGDGQTDKAQLPSHNLQWRHKYTQPGRYTVMVDVRGAKGRTNRLYFTINVHAATTKYADATLLPFLWQLFRWTFLVSLLLLLWRRHYYRMVEAGFPRHPKKEA